MPTQEVAETNVATLGLYVMPDEAYRRWEADPDGVHILDVRTFPEYVFGGHPEMAHNIRLVFPKFDLEGPTMPGRPCGCTGEPNPHFVATAKKSSAPPTRSSSCAPRADVGRWPSTHSPTPG